VKRRGWRAASVPRYFAPAARCYARRALLNAGVRRHGMWFARPAALLATALFLYSCAAEPKSCVDCGSLVLVLPALDELLYAGEKLDSLQLRVDCATIQSTRHIPPDWSLSVNSRGEGYDAVMNPPLRVVAPAFLSGRPPEFIIQGHVRYGDCFGVFLRVSVSANGKSYYRRLEGNPGGSWTIAN
jgi:hypothetical protein